jgi:hypothetical protein
MTSTPTIPKLTILLVALLKGTLDRIADALRWNDLINLQAQVRDQLGMLGLDLVIDENEGYAFARQRPSAEGEVDPPRLVRRRPLTFEVSLVLALLRRRMVEHESTSGERLIVTGHQVADLLKGFLPELGDERKTLRDARKPLREIADLGFIRILKDRDDEYEVLRILRAYVDAQWMGDFSAKLDQYRQHAVAKAGEDEA